MFSKKKAIPYYLIAPAFVLILTILIYPLIYLLGNSFFDFTLLRQAEKVFVGLGNYWKLVSNRDFWYFLLITFQYVVSSTTLTFFIGLGIAIILNKRLPFTRIFRSIYLLPMVATPVIVALTWRHIWNFHFGIMNFFLGKIGFKPVLWLAKPELAMIAIIITDVWQWTPFVILVISAGLAAIPEYMYEAAIIDGCSPWQRFKYITLPSMKAIIGVTLAIRIIDIFRNADLVYVITAGGPGIATEVLAYSIFRKAVVSFRVGEAAALAFILLILVTITVTTVLKRFEVNL